MKTEKKVKKRKNITTIRSILKKGGAKRGETVRTNQISGINDLSFLLAGSFTLEFSVRSCYKLSLILKMRQNSNEFS